jgi:hypothetical protein
LETHWKLAEKVEVMALVVMKSNKPGQMLSGLDYHQKIARLSDLVKLADL